MQKKSFQSGDDLKKRLVWVVLFSLLTPIYAQNLTIKIACVGNSITEGFGRENPGSYPNQLGALLGEKYLVRNFGMGGRTLLKNGDYPYWNETLFELAQDFQPDLVILLLGTNDSKPQNWTFKDEFWSDYVDLVNVFRRLDSAPEIFVGFPPPVFQDGWGINNQIIQQEIIPLIDSVRTTLRTFHINFYDNMLHLADHFPDGIHPDVVGYAEMARIAAQAILQRPSGVIHYFYANPAVIEENETATLFWEASDSSIVTLDHQIVEKKDSLAVSPAQTTDYTLITSGEFQDTSTVQITFLPSGTIKTFYAKSPMLEKDAGDSTVLFWGTTHNSQVWLDGQAVPPNDSICISPGETRTYTLIAHGAEKDTSQLTVSVLPANEINRSLQAQSYSASSTEYKFLVAAAFDNDTSTCWMSAGHAAEWISVDLGRELFLNRIRLYWGEIYASLYRIEILDATGKMSVFKTITAGDGAIDDIRSQAIKGRHVRILCLKSSSSSAGYKIKEFEIYGSIGSSGVNFPSSAPVGFNLLQNYPNPFNPATMIGYFLPAAGPVDLSIYNSLGQKVCTLISRRQTPGFHSVSWNGSDYASGVYLCKLTTESGKIQTRKLILQK